MTLGGILEFFLGNTFSFVVFCSFGGLFYSIMIHMSITASFNAFNTYGDIGLQSPGFFAAFGLYFNEFAQAWH